MSNDIPELGALNVTELLAIIRRQTGMVVRRSLAKERLIELVETGSRPLPEEISGTQETRRILQVFIEKNQKLVISQLPCTGPNRGRCTIYPCPEGRHLDCFVSNARHII